MEKNKVLVLRTPSGLSGDMMLTGLIKISGLEPMEINQLIGALKLPQLKNCLKTKPHEVNHVSGWRTFISLPKEHHHRAYSDIKRIIRSSALKSGAKTLAGKAFELLAITEGRIHNIPKNKVFFHEVGALDSIVDVLLSAVLFDFLKPTLFVCSPLPICDGVVHTHHGPLPTPAPATMELLKGIPVYGIDSVGETVTPTAVALLKSFHAKFEVWPKIIPEKMVRVYGGRVLPKIVNGAIFVWGSHYHRGK